jgi:hypothetical protein
MGAAPLLMPSTRRAPVLSGPQLIPKPRVSRQVFLAREQWAGLKETAKFHAAVFKELQSNEGLTRNDLIEWFLEWAEGAYWEQIGGRPTSKEDWEAKVKKHADQLRKLQAQKLKK